MDDTYARKYVLSSPEETGARRARQTESARPWLRSCRRRSLPTRVRRRILRRHRAVRGVGTIVQSFGSFLSLPGLVRFQSRAFMYRAMGLAWVDCLSSPFLTHTNLGCAQRQACSRIARSSSKSRETICWSGCRRQSKLRDELRPGCVAMRHFWIQFDADLPERHRPHAS